MTLSAAPAATRTPLVIRHVRVPDDLRAMNAVANRARAAEGEGWVTSDEQFAWFYGHLRNCDLASDVFVAERATTVVGYGRASWRDELDGDRIYEPIPFADPDEPAETLAAIHDAMERRCREIAAAEHDAPARYLEAEAQDTALDRVRILRDRGYQPVRWFYAMVRPNLDDLPDARLPAGLQIRTVRPEHLRAIFDAEVEAFRDHWGAIEPTAEDFEQFANDPVDGGHELWRVAWDGDEVAGMVRGFVNEEENARYGRQRGFVEHISVRRPWRRRGLARALIAATIVALRERGMTDAGLGVDSQNVSGALRLYESCGFQVDRRGALYRRALDPA